MATRIFAIDPNLPATQVKENVGPTGTSATIALVVDLGVTLTEGSSTRVVSKKEVLQALERFTEYIVRANTWPPA